jgi:hypothetical protein
LASAILLANKNNPRSVCLISIIRIICLGRLSGLDIVWELSTVAYWGAVEVNLAIICACLTTLKPLITKLFPKALGSGYGTYGTNGIGNTTHRGGGGGGTKMTVTTAKRPHVDVEGGSFSELHDDSSAAALPMEEFESHSDRRLDLTTPTGAYAKQGL